MIRMRAAMAGAALALVGGALGSPGEALDLETALREVAAANPTLAARTATVEAARRRVAPAGAWPSPVLELGVVNVPVGGGFDQDPMTMKMVGLSQRVPIFGRAGLSRRSADGAFRAEGAAAEMTAYEMLGAAWRAYADAYHAGELERHAAAHRDVMDRMVETARARYESGRGRLEEVLRAEAERARVLSDLAAFRSEELAAHARLDALRGREPGRAHETLAAPPEAAVPAGPATWLAAVTLAHPRLRELTAQTERYRFGAQASRRTAWPDLELRGSYGFREDLSIAHPGGHIESIPQDDMWSASVGLMLPIFARQSELSEAAEMDAMAQASASERAAAELELRERVAAAHASALAAQRSEHLLADTVVVAQQKALEASWSAYSVGQVDLWRVFEAAHALYGEQIALTRARQQLASAQAELIAATGRGDLLGVTLPQTTRGTK